MLTKSSICHPMIDYNNTICTKNIVCIKTVLSIKIINNNNNINIIDKDNISHTCTCESGKKYKNCCGKNS